MAGIQGSWGFSGDGGPATQAKIWDNYAIAFSLDGQSMFISDYNNNRIRMVKDGIITAVAGNGTSTYTGDGVLATDTGLNWPNDVSVLPTTGELVIADTFNHRIRKVSSSGIISTIAGGGSLSFWSDNVSVL